ncbi:MAG TPA: hypothetical protein VIS49_00255 [Cyclobacteriaceae bacterium]
MKFLLSILLCITSLSASQAQRSGIRGQLYWMSPDPDFKPSGQNIPYQGVPLEIYVHQLTTEAEVDLSNGKINKVYTPVVTRLFSKSNGTFKTHLPPGQYSVFVHYKNAFYGNLIDNQGNISPAIIADNKKTAWVTITITYDH